MTFRGFTMGGEAAQPDRTIEDAPQELRQEIVDLAFHIAEQNPCEVSDDRIYRVICQSLGETVSGQPYGGYRYKAGRAMQSAQWPRVYDVVLRLVPDFRNVGHFEAYRDGVNRILAAHGVVWELDENGNLRRVLPSVVQAQVRAAIEEMSAPRFAPALALFEAARDAYDDRPRRDRDACSNVFDAMESVAKEMHAMPDATFGQVVQRIGQTKALNSETTVVLQSLNTLRNRNFGHGMTAHFDLTGPEVDFTYLTCLAGILLLARTITA
jgi:hypothetical protein